MSGQDPPKQPPKREVFLSEYLANSKNFITEQLLMTYRNKVKALASKQNKTPDEESFVLDYITAVVDARVGDSKLDSMVENRAKQQNNSIVTAANSTAVASQAQTQSQQWQLQPAAGNKEGTPMVVKLNELVITPSKFEGQRQKAKKWLDDYHRAAKSNSWNEATMAKYFQTFLLGPAIDWYAVQVQKDEETTPTWRDIRTSFCSYFIGKDEDLALERQLKETVQGQNEAASAFISRYARLLNLADPYVSQSRMLGAIRIRLKPELVERLTHHHATTIDELNAACSEIEDALASARAATKLRRPSENDTTRPAERRNTDRRNAPRKPIDDKKCHRCDRAGHLRADCFATKKEDGTELKDKAPRKPPAAKKTVNAIEERQPTPDPTPTIIVNKRCCTIVNRCGEADKGDLILKDIIINGKKCQALIDCGAERSIINAETSSMNGWVPKGPIPSLSTADGTPIKCFGALFVDMTMTIGNTDKTIQSAKFLVGENLCKDVILGNDLLGMLRVMIDMEAKSIHFKREPKSPKGIQAAETVEIPPRSQKVIKATVPPEICGTIQTIRFNTGQSEVMIANSICEVNNGVVECLCTNFGATKQILEAKQRIASYEILDENASSKINAIAQIEETQSFVIIGDNLSAEQIDGLMQVINENRDAFSHNGELGSTDLVEHDIELIDGARPWAEPLRRRPLAHKQETESQIRDMLEKGIIEESHSPWASAYVLAKKKSGELRLCVDFRRLNEATKKWAYPLPNVDDCVKTLAGKRYFSQLDMASGYWQLPLSTRAKELTAFRSETGHWQFKRLPFGLCNAPASFSRLVNVLFSGLTGLNLQVFIDDLCIATASWEEHLEMLTKVLRIFIKSNLKLKANKCSFGMNKVVFLGHEISESGVRQDPEKLKEIKKLSVPKNVSKLREVLGMMGYYRKFVPNFSIIAEPMTRLLRKKSVFSWAREQQTAFDTIRQRLLENGTLAHFDYNAPTALKTDACKLGIAAILLQQIDGEWKIVDTCSRRLQGSEENYAITELEALAVVWSVDKFRHYLLGIHFRIITDHCALCQVFKNPSPCARLNRWRLVLQEFRFDVVYTKGSMHADVDCLSRIALPDETDALLDDKILAITHQEAAQTIATVVTPLNVRDWASLTAADEEAKQFAMKAKHRRDGFKLVNDLLYKNNKLFVPLIKRHHIIDAAHSSSLAGHGGIKATLARLESFWWPSLSLDVTRVVESCHQCQLRKTPRLQPAGEMRSHKADEPLEIISIDCLGKLPETMSHKQHVIVAVDVFTRFVVAKAIKDVRASTAKKFLLEFVGRFGVPKRILTDNAPTFANEQFRSVAAQYEFEHVMSTPHHHEGNSPVERQIQTIQEKLAIIVNSPNADIDWELALQQAILSINTSMCSSTGFSPYELMFARKHGLLQLEFEKSKEEEYLKTAARRAEEWKADATAKQSAAKEQSKTRFDSAHRQISFEIGDLVLPKKMGRLNKLSNRFDEPHEIIERSNDIYRLKNLSNDKVIERHIQDMKAYQVRVAFIHALLLTQSITASPVFERAAPILWTEAKQYVSPGLSHIKIRLDYATPCEALRQLPNVHPDAVEYALRTCQLVFHEQVIQRLSLFNIPPARNPNLDKLARKGMSPAKKYEDVMANKNITPSPRLKRELGWTTGFVTCSIVSTVIETIVSKIWDHAAIKELQSHQEQLKEEVNKLIHAMNATQLLAEAVQSALVNQATLIHHNMVELHNLQIQQPTLMVVISHIVARMVQLGSDLSHLQVSFRQRKPDLGLLATITNTTVLDKIDEDSIVRPTVQASFIPPSAVQFEFVAHQREQETKVYSVDAFRFWDNLIDAKPVQWEYAGPKFLIYNTTNHCVRGIADPKNDFVNVRCYETGYEDPELARWVKIATTDDPWSQPGRTYVKESWPYVYLYCFTLNVTYVNETRECPPFVFRLSAMESWDTPDYHYNPNAIEIQARVEVLVSEIQSIHFRNQSQAIDENLAIKQVIKYRRDLKDATAKLVAINFSSGGLSYPALLAIMTTLFTFGLAGLGYRLYLVEKRSQERHEQVIASVADPDKYGTRLYETMKKEWKKEHLGTNRAAPPPPGAQVSHQCGVSIPMTNNPAPSTSTTQFNQ